MSDNASIFLTGEILPGFVKEDVASALARLLKADERKAASLLAGRETMIRRNAAPEDVERYLRAFRKAGAVARSGPAIVAAAAPAPAEKSNAPAPSAQAPQGLSLAPVWSKPEEASGQAAGAGYGRQASASRGSGAGADEDMDDEEPLPDYGDVSPFGISTHGRIGRLRYMAYFWLPMALILGMAILAPSALGKKPGIGFIVLLFSFMLALAWMSLRVVVLRLHDLNRSGKWVLVPILLSGFAGAANAQHMIPILSGVSWLVSFAMLILAGSDDTNDYGPPPPPNSLWVQIGAVAFLIFWGLGVVATVKYDRYVGGTPPVPQDPMAMAQNADPEVLAKMYAEQLNARTPLMIGNSLRLDKVEYADQVLRYKATVQGKGLIITDEKKDILKQAMLKAYCGRDKNMKLFPSKQRPTEFVFRYPVSTWDYDNFTIKFMPDNC